MVAVHPPGSSLLLRFWPLAWVLALGPALIWVARTFTRPEYYPNALILLLVITLMGRGYLQGHRLGPLSPRVAPLVLSLSSLAIFWWAERTIDVSIISATAAFTGLYGLLGLFISPGRWRRARAGLLLALAALPFAEQAHHYVGFALRILTAELVASQLANFGFESVASQTILVLENGVTHIEAACSGLRSVWAGSLLLLGLCYARGYPVGRGLLLALVAQSTLLLIGNAVRITAIVLLVHHYQWPWAAEVVHQPLGVLAFCGAGWMGARILTLTSRRPKVCKSARPLPIAPRRLALLLTLVGGLALASYERRAHPQVPLGRVQFELPPHIRTTPVKLTPTETDLFKSRDARATKLNLHTESLDASIILVAAGDWRVHHPPALCLAGAGHRLDAPQARRFGEFVHATYSTTNLGQRTAVHWFQSASRTTPDILDRIEDGVFGQPKTWVLVSILIHKPMSADAPELAALIDDIQRSVGQTLLEQL